MKTAQAIKNLFRAIRSDVRKACGKLDNVMRQHFAVFAVIDNAGTCRFCYTLKEAQSWLAYCSERAAVLRIVDGTVLEKRIQYV